MNNVEKVLSEIPFPFDPHDYQAVDAERACLAHSFGLYLDMGLGKTFTSTIVGIHKLMNGYETSIVLCPAALVTQWSDWLNSLHGLSVAVYRGDPNQRIGIILDCDFVVMSYQIWQRDYVHILNSATKPIYFIVDEATVLCNIKNLTYKLLMGGVKKETYFHVIPTHPNGGFKRKKKVQIDRCSDGICLLTGTPINKPLDAYGLIKITNPTAYRSYGFFERQHVRSYTEFRKPESYKSLQTLRNNLLLNGSIREVTDHLDLPEKVYNIIEYDLDPAHKALYDRLIDERLVQLDDGKVIDATEAQSLYHWSQRIIFCPEHMGYSKDPAGIELLDSVLIDVRQAVIFAHYKDTNRKVVERYGAGGCYGEVSRKQQDENVRLFKAGELAFIAANTKSAGYGLNLQVTDQVIAIELPITPRDFRQMEARVWRQGQTRRVMVTVFVARGTIQKTLHTRIKSKDDLMIEVTHSKQSLRDDLRGEGK